MQEWRTIRRARVDCRSHTLGYVCLQASAGQASRRGANIVLCTDAHGTFRISVCEQAERTWAAGAESAASVVGALRASTGPTLRVRKPRRLPTPPRKKRSLMDVLRFNHPGPHGSSQPASAPAPIVLEEIHDSS